jgi:hypothetical protein
MTEPTGVRRIDRGRGHSYQIDGRKADGVTTLIGDGMPKPALVGWAANTTAAYAVDHWDELADVPLSKRLDTLKRARYLDLDTASKRGTEVHKLAEKLSHGEEIDVPDELAGHVESAVKFLDDWRPEVVMTEAVVASRKWGYAGTFDLLMKLPDGRTVLADYKTSRSGIWGETALQLGAYANADVYLDADGVEHPITDLGIDAGMAVWIRADGYDVYEVDLAEGFRIFQHVAWVARQAKGMKERLVSEALTMGAVA